MPLSMQIGFDGVVTDTITIDDHTGWQTEFTGDLQPPVSGRAGQRALAR